jgi:hypothetical protein
VEEKTGLQDGDFIKWIIVAVITAAGTAAGAIGASVNKKKRAAD